jgi:hypothetical protein
VALAPLIGLPQSADERTALIRALGGRDGWHCVWCSLAFTRERRPTLEHLIPRSQQGSDGQANLLLACLACNAARGDQEALTWLAACIAAGQSARRKLVHKRLRANGVTV